jgi:thiol-disulfide isomerase/thioredoxin
VVLLDFWATWCGPCKAEIPHLVKLYNKYKSQGLVVIGVGLDKQARLADYVKQNGVTYITLVDEKSASAKAYNVSGIPRTLMIDKKGRIAFDHTGYSPGMESQVEAEITGLLAEEY